MAGLDNQDKDFEAFLAQFRLRQLAPFLDAKPENPASRAFGNSRRWILAAAACVLVIVLSVAMWRNSRPVTQTAAVEVPVDVSDDAGRQIAGETAIPVVENDTANSRGTKEPPEAGVFPIDAESRRQEIPSERRRVVVIPESVAGGPVSATAPASVPITPPAPIPPSPQEQENSQPQQPELRAEALGKQVFTRACGQCHSLDVINNQRYDNREAYATLVSREISYGATVNQPELRALVDYLWSAYGDRPKR